MKIYELETWIDEIDGTQLGRVVLTDAEGNKKNIPLNPANSDYAEYLRYTAWVEAGNNPEEFWTRLEAGDN